MLVWEAGNKNRGFLGHIGFIHTVVPINHASGRNKMCKTRIAAELRSVTTGLICVSAGSEKGSLFQCRLIVRAYTGTREFGH